MAGSRVKKVPHSLLSTLALRHRVILAANVFFFGIVLLTLVILTITRSLQPLLSSPPTDFQDSIRNIDWLAKALTILSHNLLATFLYSTLPGIVFFPLAFAIPFYNGILWGAVSYRLTDAQFFTVLPTLIFEGEAVVLTAVAAMILGVSHLKPKWLYKEEGYITRTEGFKRALREALGIYLLAIVFFIVAAIIETVTEYSLTEIPL